MHVCFLVNLIEVVIGNDKFLGAEEGAHGFPPSKLVFLMLFDGIVWVSHRHCTRSNDRSLTTGRQCRIAPNE